MEYKASYYLTGRCLGLDVRPENREMIVGLIVAGEVNWEVCLQLWCEQLVATTLYLRLRDHDLLTFLPEEPVGTLTEIYELNCRRNAQILQQVDQLCEVLHREKIYPVFLKGTAHLLMDLYGDPGERIIHDIDLLVDEEDYLRTVGLLKRSGYGYPPEGYGDFRRLKHYPPLHKKGEPAVVEIHRPAVPQAYAGTFSTREIIRNRQPVKGRPGVYVPSDRHRLIHTFLHSEVSNKGHAYKQSSFRALNDLLQMSKGMSVFTLPTYTIYRQKAICWLVWGQRVLGLPGRFYPFETWGARWYVLRYELSLAQPGLFRGYLFVRKLTHVLFVRYLGGLVKALLWKEHRLSALRRLQDPAWYGAHLRSYRGYF